MKRLTPILPNVFINLASPIVEIPFGNFFVTTFLGVLPANTLYAHTGLFLREASSIGLQKHVQF